jgi:hypothetical protein
MTLANILANYCNDSNQKGGLLTYRPEIQQMISHLKFDVRDVSDYLVDIDIEEDSD